MWGRPQGRPPACAGPVDPWASAARPSYGHSTSNLTRISLARRHNRPLNLGGQLTILRHFAGTDGAYPYGGLVQATDGNLYGTTSAGGTNGQGTVFSVSVGLGPFVKTLPTSARAGAAIKILGTNPTGATKVSFHGTAATFTVVSPSEISTNVPIDATTGYVRVTTPGGALCSNVVFRVTP